MAKVYDPILCMMVDKPDKAKDSSIRGFFKSQLGKEFHKDFESIDKLMEFVRSAKSVGTKFVGSTSVVDAAKAQDESYVVRGKKYKVVKRDGDNVTVIGPDGKVTKMHIDFLMSEGKKASDSASTIDKAITTADGMLAVEKHLACTES